MDGGRENTDDKGWRDISLSLSSECGEIGDGMHGERGVSSAAAAKPLRQGPGMFWRVLRNGLNSSLRDMEQLVEQQRCGGEQRQCGGGNLRNDRLGSVETGDDDRGCRYVEKIYRRCMSSLRETVTRSWVTSLGYGRLRVGEALFRLRGIQL